MATYTVQHVDGASRTGAAGNLILGDDGSNLQTIHTDASGDLQVDVLTMPTTTVTGTVAATQSGTWSVRITDGTDTMDVFDLTNSNPAAVAIVDGNGDQITSFGGGTQYTEGDTDATITGTAILWEDTSDTLRAVSVAKPLPVQGSGTAGTAATGVVTVQGIASMTPVQVSQATASNLNATVVQGTATNLKTQAEAYQGGSAVSSSNPLHVTMANGRAPVSGTATVSSVLDSATSVTLHSSTPGRLGLTIFNNSTEILYVKLGTTASLTDFSFTVMPLGYYEMPGPTIYTGNIDGIWAANGSGAALVTELT